MSDVEITCRCGIPTAGSSLLVEDYGITCGFKLSLMSFAPHLFADVR